VKVGSNQVRVLLTGFIVMLLSACASNPRENSPANNQEIPASMHQEVPVQTNSHCDALSYYEVLAEMTADELKQEQLLLREQLIQNENVCDPLRLVMSLGLPEAGAKDEKEASQLIKEILNGGQYLSPQDRQILRLLENHIQWRNKMRLNQQSLNKQLKKERDASLNLLERLAEAQSKLKQLKNIDKDINKQEQEISTPSTDKIPHESK